MNPERRPRVSIAMPVFNGGEWIGRAVASAVAQTERDVEIVVVDNASTDGTVDAVRRFGDARIRVHVNAENIGYNRNMNRAVELSRGEFVKFLHADDELVPSAVERLLECFEDHPRVGMAFARRRVEVADETDPELLWWRDTYGAPHQCFGGLDARNDGAELLRRYLEREFDGNWIGEPSSVMLRREAVERLGLFSNRIVVSNDVDMWARAMTSYDIGFVDDELSIFRIGQNNLTRAGKHRTRDWLDRLWMLQGLVETPGAAERFPELRLVLRREYWRVARTYATIVRDEPTLAGEKARDLGLYLSYKLDSGLGRAEPLYPPLAPVVVPGELPVPGPEPADPVLPRT